MARIFTAQRNILTLDEREDLEDDEKEEFSEYESFFLYLIGQCRREGGKRVQGNDMGKKSGTDSNSGTKLQYTVYTYTQHIQ